MLGDWFSSLGKKLATDTQDPQEKQRQPAQAASKDSVSDFFSQLEQTQGQPKDGSAASDPFAFFESPERQPPHVSKQKPTLTAFQPVINNSDGAIMPSLPLFQNDRNDNSMQETVIAASTQSDNNMWAKEDSDLTDDGDDIVVPEESKVPLSNALASVSASPCPEKSENRKRDYLQSWVSRASTLIKKGAETVATTAGDAVASGITNDSSTGGENAKVIGDVVNLENNQLKECLKKQQQRIEDLHEEIEVHQSLEEEAHEANEELLFKVKYLEELARENGNDLELMKRVEELGQEKKSLQRQVTANERQIRVLENIKFGKDSQASSEEETKQMLEDPKKALQDLKSLYEQHRIQFSRSDEARVLTAIYTQDKPVIRLYRELLFRRIAQKALEAAESLFKQTNSTDRNGSQTCKLLIDNRRLQAQNDTLKKQLSAAQSETKSQRDQRMEERVRWRHKLSRVCDKAQDLAGQVSGVRKMMTTVFDQVKRTQTSLDDDEVLTLSEQKFNSYLQYFMSEQLQQMQTAQQKLDDQCERTKQEKEKANEQETHGREVFEQLCQVQSERATMQDELGEAKEAITHLEDELDRANSEIDQNLVANNVTENTLQQKIDQLEQSLQEAKEQLIEQQVPEPVAIEASPPAVAVQSSPENKLQISELEKMLEEREEEIIELMQEVNKLQVEKQLSPEVVLNTLQTNKSKPRNSQQRFHGQQYLAKDDFETDVKTQVVEDVTSNSLQHVPILIVDEAGEKSSQGESPPTEVQVEEHKTDDLYQNVRARLEEVRQERLEEQKHLQPSQLSPEVREPFSRIVKDGKESNFFSSLVENSGDKLQTKSKGDAKPMDDLFGFLMEPNSSQENTSKADTLNLGGDNWSEAFGFPLSQTSSKQQLIAGSITSSIPNLRLHPTQLKGGDMGWGNEDEDDIELDQESDDNRRQASDEPNSRKPSEFAQIQQLDVRGEIMLQESLENSPIRTKRSNGVDVLDQQLGSKDDSLDDQQDIFVVTDHIKLKLTECVNESNDSDSRQSENDDKSVRQMDSYHKRSIRLPIDQPVQPNQPQSLESSILVDEDTLQRSRCESFVENQSQNLSVVEHNLSVVEHNLSSVEHQSQNHNSISNSIAEQHLHHLNSADDQMNESSYMAAIESMQDINHSNERPSQDISNEVFERLMGAEMSEPSQSDSMLHGNSPFDNSFTRQEVELVVQTLRKNSLEMNGGFGQASCSPLNLEEKKVNISNLSDLVPEDPVPDKLNDTEMEDIYTRMMRPGELNEVTEVEEPDEDVSDDQVCSPKADLLPIQIHPGADSATIIVSGNTNKQQQQFKVPMLPIHQFIEEPPSMNESSKFEIANDDSEEDKQYNDCSMDSEGDEQKDKELLVCPEILPMSLSLRIQTSDSGGDHSEKRVASARSHHRRHDSIDENPFMAMNIQTTQTTPRPVYENLAEFTKDNLINYEADGKTISQAEEINQENTCGFDSQVNEQILHDLDQPEDSEEEDRPREVTNVNGSAFFSRDFRVMKNATYGHQANQGDMIMKRLQEEHGSLDTSKAQLERDYEQNEQTFDHKELEEPSLSQSMNEVETADLAVLEGNFGLINMQEFDNIAGSVEGSIDNKLDSFDRGSLHMDSMRLQNFLGSMIQQQQSSIDQGNDQDLMNNEQDGTEDGIPMYDEYIEQNSRTISSPSEENDAEAIQLEADEDIQLEAVEDIQLEAVEDIQLEAVEYLTEEDDRSLEEVSVMQSADVSPAKTRVQDTAEEFQADATTAFQEMEEEEKMPLFMNQSNQQDPSQNSQRGDGSYNGDSQDSGPSGAGWEGDESLEEIDSFDGEGHPIDNDIGHHIVNDYGSQKNAFGDDVEPLNRSVSGNEQVSDAIETQHPEEPRGLSQPCHQRQDTPIPPLKATPSPLMHEESSNQQDGGMGGEVRGWDEDSADVSIEDDLSQEAKEQPVSEELQEESHTAMSTLQVEEVVQEEETKLSNRSPSKVDLSMTQQAEIAESDKFNCPNGHKLTIIDGRQHPLPSQECSATCGMANRQNSLNWLRCRECFYKVCHDCFHCADGHEMQSVSSEVAVVAPEACCQSCGNEFDDRIWMCERRAQALQSQSQQPMGCADNSLICQDCLGLGSSFIQASLEEYDMPELDTDNLLEEQHVSAAQNEQVEELVLSAPITSLDEMFASQKPAATMVAVDDPFSMLMGGNNSPAQEPFSTAASSAPQSTTEVGGTGGGWGDDEDDDLDID